MRKINWFVVKLFFALLVFQLPAHALTLGDMKIQIRRIINDKANPGIKFTDEEILSYINEAQREIVTQTWCLTNRASITLTAATTYYSLPTDLMAIQHVEFKDSTGRTRSLTEVSEKGKQQDSPDYERIAGPPMEYFVRDSTSSTSSTLQIAFLPVPSTTTTLGTVTYDYFNQPIALAADSDVPFDGLRHLYPYHYAIVYSAIAMMKDAKQDPTAAATMQAAQSYVKLMMDRLGMMPNYNPGFSSGTNPAGGTR